jgi:hypothetical protein
MGERLLGTDTAVFAYEHLKRLKLFWVVWLARLWSPAQPPHLMHNDDAHVAATPCDCRGDILARAVQEHIGFGIAEPQPPHMQVIEKRREQTLSCLL